MEVSYLKDFVTVTAVNDRYLIYRFNRHSDLRLPIKYMIRECHNSIQVDFNVCLNTIYLLYILIIVVLNNFII